MRSFLLVLTASLGLGACSGSDERAAVRPERLPECPQLDTAPCDTRTAACQRRLLELASCMYGVERAPDVPIRVVSEAQLLQELAEEASEVDGDADEVRNLPHVERALVDLKLLAPGALTDGGGANAELVDRVDGVYQNAERGIALVDRGRPKDDPETAAVLVHEFVHAIQDERYDLESWRQQLATDVDSSLALRSVSEGQATYAQFRALYAMLGYDLGRFDLGPALDDFRRRILDSAYDDASPYLASFTTFPYAIGVGPAARAWSPTGLHFAEQQFEDPPLTSLQALGDSYALDLTPHDARVLEPPSAKEGYELVDQTRLGAFLLELFAHQQGFDPSRARSLGQAWVTDRLWIYAGPEQQTAWLWEIELSDASSRELDDLLASSGAISRDRQGSRVFLAGHEPVPDFLLEAGRAFLNPDP